MLRLYYANVRALDTDAPGCALSDYRRAKLSKQKNPAARRQGLGAELLLRHALRDAAAEYTWPPTITVGENGKPAWDVEGLYFNLSHSGDWAACAIADRPLGLDVQERCAYCEGLVRRFFSEAERREIEGAADRDQAFGRIWSLKESWIKALGTGLSTPLASFSVVGKNRVDAAFWYDFREGCHFALCLPAAESAVPDAMIRVAL